MSKGWVEIGALNIAKVTQGVGVTRLIQAVAAPGCRATCLGADSHRSWVRKEKARKAFCRKYRCRYENHDGRQWMHTGTRERYGEEVWSILQGWGCVFLPAESAYFRQVSAGASPQPI
ncbi:MAG: hypothetical protein EPO42_02885 [Gallionellaceae bacterium]|nr:MAG: hypothetical protein EPO42_02885 [Gallionellaceae bacterium]